MIQLQRGQNNRGEIALHYVSYVLLLHSFVSLAKERDLRVHGVILHNSDANLQSDCSDNSTGWSCNNEDELHDEEVAGHYSCSLLKQNSSPDLMVGIDIDLPGYSKKASHTFLAGKAEMGLISKVSHLRRNYHACMLSISSIHHFQMV